LTKLWREYGEALSARVGLMANAIRRRPARPAFQGRIRRAAVKAGPELM
jgi:hypothetical protein